MKTGKRSFKRGIIVLHFGEKYASPFTHFRGTVADALGVPSGLPLAMEYHATVAVNRSLVTDDSEWPQGLKKIGHLPLVN